jgi:hypothetical protein
VNVKALGMALTKMGCKSGGMEEMAAGLSDFVNALTRAVEKIDFSVSVPDEVARDAARYQLLRLGQYWSVVDGSGQHLRGDELDASLDGHRHSTEPDVLIRVKESSNDE